VEVLFPLLSNYLHPKSPKIHAQTNNGVFDGTHKWSPNGTKIAFLCDKGGNEICVMNSADGTGQTNITDNNDNDAEPDWGTASDTEP
jgi:Tol biopolymer transport system component